MLSFSVLNLTGKMPVLLRCSLTVALSLPLVVGCPRTPSVWLQRQDRLESAVEDAVRVAGFTANGHQSVQGDADHGGKVVVQAQVRAGGADQADAQAALDAVLVHARRKGDAIDVGWTWKTEHAKSWGASVDFDIRMPPTLQADFTTHNGAVTVRGLSGGCRLETHNGKVSAETSGPELRASSHNGALDVTTSAAEVALETHNGAITAKLIADGEVGGEISTHNGGIVVILGEAAATALDCSTSNGAIHCDRDLQQSRVKPDRLAGSINGGIKTLKIESHNGSIKVQ